ncbi:ketopantoate reductase family protein [Kitasatospora sp. NBC_00070]|uniref:ketopantoate reductase family protein n=1 Tax=Kitasatospora sp. NBC_00070 TaxID=2975962 RepID=UPI00324489A4
MKILIVGAGATGGYFGARLAQAGQDVTFLVRPGRAEVLRKRGLRIVGPEAEEVVVPRLVTADELDSPYDVVLLTVKATALERSIEDVVPAIGPGTVLVPVLNGMAHLEVLNARFGSAAVLGGVAKVVTTLNEDGDIVRLAPPAVLTVGAQDGPAERAEEIAGVLRSAGIDGSASADIVGAMWHKWVFISTVGAVTCLLRGTVGEINAVPGGTGFAAGVLAETAAVAAAAGHPVPVAELALIEDMVTQSGSPLVSSMYRDVVAGRPAEVEQLLGDLVARARELRVATPLLDLATLHLRVHQQRAVQGG